MSTAILSPRTVSTPRATTTSSTRTRLRITRRGRAVLTVLVSIPVVVLIALAVLNGGQASAGNTQAHVHFQTVTIVPGESLWQLAEHQAPGTDPRDFIQDVVSLNNLSTSVVQAGQTISIPTKYSAAH